MNGRVALLVSIAAWIAVAVTITLIAGSTEERGQIHNYVGALSFLLAVSGSSLGAISYFRQANPIAGVWAVLIAVPVILIEAWATYVVVVRGGV